MSVEVRFKCNDCGKEESTYVQVTGWQGASNGNKIYHAEVFTNAIPLPKSFRSTLCENRCYECDKKHWEKQSILNKAKDEVRKMTDRKWAEKLVGDPAKLALFLKDLSMRPYDASQNAGCLKALAEVYETQVKP